jgi:hypothetical protein
MRTKIINVAVFCLFSLFVADRANAGLIINNTYSDGAGLQWQYIGSFDLTDGPAWNGATPLNGIEAAIISFGSLSAGEFYALSSMDANAASFLVNHNAWYDSYFGRYGVSEFSESAIANNAGGVTYDSIGDISAFIQDRANPGTYLNHVFKSVTTSVPEPSTLAIFALALVGLTTRRLKK